jgi:ATPase subunit of ABC transporter with duplicated ATPase domains
MASKVLLSLGDFSAQTQLFKPALKYNAATETKDPHSWWELDRDKILANLKDIAERVASCTKGATELDRELEHVMKTAAKLPQVERTRAVKIALIGAQGAGKSLLINALFDRTGLSLTGARGFACTSAIVKYAYGPGDKFSAEVQYLNAKMREEMIDGHIRSYMDYHNDLEDSEDEDGPRTKSFKQDEIDRKRKKTAEDFFDTIFGSRMNFSVLGARTPSTLQSSKAYASSNAKRRCRWTT